MTLGATMNIAQQALTVNQFALNVVSNNIANMNTAGYVKQRVELGDIVSFSGIPTSKGVTGYIGAGVEIVDIMGYRSNYLDNVFRDRTTDSSMAEQMYVTAKDIEGIMNELGEEGLQKELSSFFEAANAMMANPTTKALRINYTQAASNLCDKFNDISASLINAKTLAVGDINIEGTLKTSKINLSVEDFNNKLQELADINVQILQSSTSGSTATSLENKQSQILDELSSYAPITTTFNENGTVNISVNGANLLKGKALEGRLECVKGTTEDKPVIIQLVDNEGNILRSDLNDKFNSGLIGGILATGSNVSGEMGYSQVLKEVDKLANAVATEINAVQKYFDGNIKAQCISFDTVTNEMILKDSEEFMFLNKLSGDNDNITAANICVNQDIVDNPWEIAAARLNTGSADYDNRAVGDTKNLLAINEARNTRVVALDNQTFEQFIASIATEIGANTSITKTKYETANDTLTQVQTERESVMGVNLDEELIDLVKYQRAYEAAARVFNVASTMMDTLINLGR